MTEGVREPAYRKRIGYQAGLLGGFATMAAVLLLLGDLVTRDIIQARQLDDLRASLAQVLPAARFDNRPEQDILRIVDEDGHEHIGYRGVRDFRVEGVALPVTARGYAGAIDLLMGIDREGRVLGVRVLSHAETPGLGDAIEIEKDDWILGFNGRSLRDPVKSRWKVRKDGGQFEQFTGATITPRAVVRAVADGLRLFEDQREVLLDLPRPVDSESPADRPQTGPEATHEP